MLAVESTLRATRLDRRDRWVRARSVQSRFSREAARSPRARSDRGRRQAARCLLREQLLDGRHGAALDSMEEVVRRRGLAPVVSSGLENSKKFENRYLAQEGEPHDGDRENHLIYGA